LSNGSGAKPYLAGTLFIFLVGFSFLMIKQCVPYGDTMQIMTWRFNFALIVVIIMMAVNHVSLRSLFSGKKLALLIPATFYTLCLSLQTVGMRYTTTVEATILFSTSPLIVYIIATVFLKEKSTPLQLISIVCSVGSLILLEALGNDVSFSPLGTTMLLLASLSMALYSVYARKYTERGTPFETTAIIVIEGFIGFNAYLLISYINAGDMGRYIEPVTHMKFTFAAAYLGICCIMLSAQLMNYMLHHLQAVNATIFSNGGTIVTIIAGAVILHEPLTLGMIVCAAVIFAAIIIISSEGEKLRRRGSD
jgi:drug/metabolite transporter (DMT)-like permease